MIPQAIPQNVELDIPVFLRRKNTTEPSTMQDPNEEKPQEKPDDAPQPTVEDLIALIKNLTEKKAALTKTISDLKKQVQRMIGSL